MIFTDVVEAIKGFSIEEKLQIQCVDVQRLVRKIGECSSEIMEEIAAAIAVVVEYNE